MHFVPQIRPGETSKTHSDSKMRVSARIAGEFQACRKAIARLAWHSAFSDSSFWLE
jgi:hypothetical protein